MIIEKLPGYHFPTIAVWPEPWYKADCWQMWNYKIKPDGKLAWFRSYLLTESGGAKAEAYLDFQTAVAEAELRNGKLLENIAALDLSPELRRSFELKAIKAIQIKSRLAREEELMLSEAKRRCQCQTVAESAIIEGGPYHPDFESAFKSKLNKYPYVKSILIGGNILHRIDEGTWSRPRGASTQEAKQAVRSKIANGFGFNGDEHWGKTKAAIREILLPRANRLLQLASVQRLLADAKARGDYVLVIGEYVFWFDPDGKLDWTIKQVGPTKDSDGTTIWREGTILSKNHGRIVILPYVKENGECVRGHTRNSSHDKPAIPRHPDQYLELPFKILKDDLMIGLFGELPYE